MTFDQLPETGSIAAAFDGLSEADALDEAHGVERAAVGVKAEAVDRDNPSVLQPAGDLRLKQKT